MPALMVAHSIINLTATRSSPPVSGHRVSKQFTSSGCYGALTVLHHLYILFFAGTLEVVTP